MVTITVGQVSGVIAAIIFILQFLLPSALIVILVGVLRNEHSAVTWSVVERNLLSSYWPLFLRADTATSKGVDRSIRLVTWLKPLGLLLVTVAAVVTPLGLYDAVELAKYTVDARMVYAPDPGPFGYGTLPRPTTGFIRTCGDFGPLQCPGTTIADIQYGYVNNTGTGITVGNATIPNADYDPRIPKVLAELYQSGLAQQSGSVSSFFDIQSRTWGWLRQAQVSHNNRYVVDGFQMLSSVVLNNATEAFEGLVVDTVSGGVGFRNHTVPTGVGLGAEWSEDILFIEPETECINMNISVEFTAPWSGTSSFSLLNVTLVDDGGFANFVTEFPQLDLSSAQTDPQLRNRAYKAAWMVLADTMLIMNLTRPSPDAFGYLKSKVGDRYPSTSVLTEGASLSGIYATNQFERLLDPGALLGNASFGYTPPENYSNPFNVTFQNYTDITILCDGVGGMDLANMSNIHVECGLVFGAATRRDGTDSLVIEPDAWYTQPVYACASTTKASIKTVQFKYNATSTGSNSSTVGPDLRSLTVNGIAPKTYSDNASLPLWGVETVAFELHDLTQLWGLVSPAHEHDVNLTTKRAPELYLPGYQGTLSTSVFGYEYIPGTTGPQNALNGAYTDAANGLGVSGMVDYTGQSNIAMLSIWRDYSKDAKTVPKIMNLIWTDYAANMLVGTRSWNTPPGLPPNLQKRNGGSGSTETLVPVLAFRSQVKYHWYYGIPAFLSLALIVCVLAWAFVLMIIGRGSPSRINHYLKRLSAGRLLGAMHYPGRVEVTAPTKDWVQEVGQHPVNLDQQNRPDEKYSMSTQNGGQALPTIDHANDSRIPTHGGYTAVSSHETRDEMTFGQAH